MIWCTNWYMSDLWSDPGCGADPVAGVSPGLPRPPGPVWRLPRLPPQREEISAVPQEYLGQIWPSSTETGGGNWIVAHPSPGRDDELGLFLGVWWCHQHCSVLTDPPEEDLHWGWYTKYLHESLWSEMLLLHLPESDNNCGDRGTGGSGDKTGETSFGRGCGAKHRPSSDFSLSAIIHIESVERWPGRVDHFVRLIMSATVISVFLLFLLITASSSSVTEPLITII